MEKLRLGIVGCGGILNGAHIQSFKLVEECRVTACCDLIEDRAKKAAENLGAEHYCTDYREMVDYVDCVMIVLPHHLHFECGMFFLKNNKHVLMEKPLANSENECLQLIEEAEKRQLTLMVAYPVPYWVGVRKLKELLDSGEYGEMFQMSIWTEQFTDDRDAPWCTKVETVGGGQLFSHGCHYIDVLLRFMGKPVSGVHMGTNKGTPWMEKEGTSNITMTFEDGSMAYHFGTWGARGLTTHRYDFQVFTDKGFFDYQHMNNKLIWKADYIGFSNENGIESDDIAEQTWHFANGGKQTQYEISHFCDCVINHKVPLTDARSALQSLRVIWKLYEAEEKNEIADLRGLGIEK